MSADIPRSVMEEARKTYEALPIVYDGWDEDAVIKVIARFAIARDKRAAEIARNNDPFPEEGEYIASLILTYEEGQ
jgi:hypothetical protein